MNQEIFYCLDSLKTCGTFFKLYITASSKGKQAARLNLDVIWVYFKVNKLRHGYLNAMKLQNYGPTEEY
jgi:hypothetical protein